MHQPREWPYCKQYESRQYMRLEPPWRRRNHFRHRTESEDAPEPRADGITIVKIPACRRIPGGIRKADHRHDTDQQKYIQIFTGPFPVDPFALQPPDGQQCPADHHHQPGCTAEPYGAEVIHLLCHPDHRIDGLRYYDTGDMAEEHEYDPYMEQDAPPSEHLVILQKLTRLGRPAKLILIVPVDVSDNEYGQGDIGECGPQQKIDYLQFLHLLSEDCP